MSFDGVSDPRVVVEWSAETEEWKQTKYPDGTAPIRFARWEEAQLIIAEAAVAEGDLSTAISIINDLHAEVGLPLFDSDDAGEVMNQIIYERRAELFHEGQHLGDYRRYELPFDPAPGTLHVGDSRLYGTDRCFPIPLEERIANPNL